MHWKCDWIDEHELKKPHSRYFTQKAHLNVILAPAKLLDEATELAVEIGT